MKTINHLSHQWNETIFENRNKTYGAYELRETYEDRVKRALLVGFAFITIVIVTPLSISHFFMTETVVLPDKGITFNPISVKDDDVTIKPPEKQIKQPDKSGNTNAAFVNHPDTSNIPVDTTPVLLAAINPGTNSVGSSGAGDAPAPPSPGSVNPMPSTEIHSPWQVDKTPEFPGGQEAFYAFIKDHVHYPSPAREEDIEGTVYVSFVINAEGKVINAKLIRGIGYGLDEAAIEVIGKMPAWKPGMAHGEPVSTAMQLPIKFVTLK